MSTDATDRLAIGEIGAEAPAGQLTNEQAGSHDCALVVAPTGQGIAASLEARAGRTLLPAESNIVQNMTTDSNPSLTPSEDEVQKPASAPSVQPQSSNGCTPEVASGSPVSTLSNTSENKPEGVNLPAAVEGEPSAEAESGSSAATNSTHTKAMNANQTNPVSSGSAEEDAQGNSCEQTVQPSVEINACAASPSETEQIASSQAEPPSAVSTDSINSDAAAEAPASADVDNNNSNTITTMSTNNDTPANGSVSDVNAADVTNITPENAAALASANLNSGTDCATTSDTTMNIDTNNNDGIALASNEARATDPNAPRSESNSWYITVPECDSATISVVLGADDLGSVSVGPISLVLGPRGQYGGGTYTEVSKSASIAPGTYKVSTTYCNITLPEGIPNIARFRCDITLNVDGEEIVPTPVDIPPVDNEDEGEDETCPQTCDIQNPQPDCGCDKDENGDGDNGEPDSGAGCGGNAGAAGGAASTVAMTVDTDGEATTMTSSSGAGRKVTVRGGLQDMLWRMNFATFRGMAGIPDGALEIRAREFTTELCTPAALSFNHPFDTQVLASGGTSEKPLNGAFQIRSGSSRVNYFCFADGLVSPLAGSAKRGGKGNMLSATNAARNTTTRSLSLQDKRGGFARYDADNNGNMNRLSAYTTKSGHTYESADISSTLQVVRDGEGTIVQLWNAWDGLMVIDSVTETGYRMAFYSPHQVGAQNTATKLFAVSGSPWRTVVVAGDVENSTLQMTDTVLTREPQVSRFICGADGAWSTEQGSGSAKICRHVARELVEQEVEDAPEQYRLVTTLHRGDINSPDECVAEIWQKGATGHLCISRTLGYGSPGALTTLYEYDSEGRRIKVISPSGAVRSFTYDDSGREMVRMTPYHGNHTLAVYTYYREENSADPDISYRRAVLNETATQIWREDYTYAEQDGYRRVTKSTQALGCTEPRVEITETWLDTAEEPLCRGRLRMRQGMDGVQTWYSYAACSDFGAVYKVTAETRVNGEAVPAHSRRDVTYISAVGNNMRHEVYRLLSNGTWTLTESESYEYDSENNWVKRTRGNGRITTRTMMCCGPLSVTDEDGVTTTYGYNAAHQLEEVIREEILEDGVDITPETITTYTRDAAGRELTKRKDVGAMTTIETTQYDLLGREVSRTDMLNRTTTTAYSEDGLTTTETTTAGATLITTFHADGTLASVGGTGQRSLVYEYSVQGNALCTTTRLADEAGTLLSQTLINGFGQTLQQVQPTTTGALLSTISEYNAKGQLVKQYRQTQEPATGENEEAPEPILMAPTLYEYDSFGSLTKQTLALAEVPNSSNSPVTEFTYTLEIGDEGVFSCTTQTRYNAAGQPLSSTQKQLISRLSVTLENKTISVSERGLTSTDWTVYNDDTKRTQYSTVPTSNITAETVVVDGFALLQKDTVGITTSAARSFTASGMVLMQTDGRGNATTTVKDIAGRALTVTDAAGNVTTTAYDTAHDEPAMITDAMGNTTCYRYDERGRKVAEWGTSVQPACFGYDDADHLVSLKTFRAGAETISTDPSERPDGDVTTWEFDAATGLELLKTYADNSSVVKTYDAFNRLATETDARDIVKTHSYEPARGLLLGTTYSDTTTARSYAYNHLGQLTQVTDAAGVRTIGYNQYGEPETDSLLAGGKTHLITETRDSMGRSTGYTYAKDGSTQQTVTTGYGTDGRITTAGFMHGGAEKQFSYEYLPGTNLLEKLTLPSNMTLTQEYEPQRDLLTGMHYKRSSTSLVQRTYTYDTLGRPLTRSTARNNQTVTDSFGYNTRSELTSAIVNNGSYGYAYDNIGNRTTAQENAEEITSYQSNALNQYAMLSVDDITDFIPSYDEAGNQTRVKTTTGIWAVSYDAEKRPVDFTSQAVDGTITTVHCEYDYMGRRATKQVTVNGSITLHQRYVYRGYLQIACCDLTRSNHPCLWLITWDPSQPVATRPLAIRKDGTWYTYGWDLTKNICEVFGQHGYIRTNYSYSPYGEVTISGDVTQPIQWSGEYNDVEIDMVYYNYRYYIPRNGRCLTRDIMQEPDVKSRYLFVSNSPYMNFDYLGAWALDLHRQLVESAFDTLRNQGYFANIENPKAFKNSLSRGSTLPDNPVNSWWSILTPCLLYKSWTTYRSHFGDLQWWHSMNPGITPEENSDNVRDEIRNNIIETLVNLLRETRKNGDVDPVDLGFALHMVADSYSHGHAVRNERGEIVNYNNYKEQNTKEDHTPYDYLYPEGSEKDKKYPNQRTLFKNAQVATEKVMKAIIDPKTTDQNIRQLIETEIMPHETRK